MENLTNNDTPEPNDVLTNDELAALLAQETNDLPKGQIIDATADGVPTEDNRPPEPAPATPPEAAPIPKSAFRETAKTIVEVFSKIQEGVFGAWYKKRNVKESDYSDVRDLEQAIQERKPLAESEVLNEFKTERPSITAALQRLDNYEKYISGLALTTDEQKAISAPLADCLEKWQVQPLTPEGQLLLAVGMVMVGRVFPFLPVIGTKPVNDDE